MKHKLKRVFKRAFTVFIVPHDGEEPRSFKAPLWVFSATGILIFIFVTSFVILYYNAGNLRDETSELYQQLSEERSQQEELLDEMRSQEKDFREDKQTKEEKIEEITRETEQVIKEIENLRDLRDSVYDRVDGIDPPDDESASSENISPSPPTNEPSTEIVYSENSSSSQTRLVTPSRGGQSSLETLENSISNAEANLETIQDSLCVEKEKLESLVEELDAHNRRMRAIPSIRPTSGTFSSGFGNRRDPITGGTRFHSGVDISNSQGTPVYATAYGRVSSASYQGGYGHMVVIDHGYGYQTCYAHLSSYAVSVNEQVSRGQVIGYMGRTGRAIGSHLHYEVRINGTAVNPTNYY